MRNVLLGTWRCTLIFIRLFKVDMNCLGDFFIYIRSHNNIKFWNIHRNRIVLRVVLFWIWLSIFRVFSTFTVTEILYCEIYIEITECFPFLNMCHHGSCFQEFCALRLLNYLTTCLLFYSMHVIKLYMCMHSAFNA